MVKCIRCQTTEDLGTYKFNTKIPTGYETHTFGPNVMKSVIQTVSAPVCRTCISDFDKWYDNEGKKIRKNFRIFFPIILLIIVVVGLMYLIGNWTCWEAELYGGVCEYWTTFWAVTIILVIPEIIFSVYSLIAMYIYKSKPSYPRSYFKDKGRGGIFVRPENSKEWIPYNKWLAE